MKATKPLIQANTRLPPITIALLNKMSGIKQEMMMEHQKGWDLCYLGQVASLRKG